MDIHHETSIIFIKQMFPQVVLKNLLEKNEKFISQVIEFYNIVI